MRLLLAALLVLVAGFSAGYVTARLGPRPSRPRKIVTPESIPPRDLPQAATYEQDIEAKARALRDAMCAYLTDVDHVGERECGRRNLFGLATVIVREVDRMHSNDEWVPLGRAKAPTFLSALVRFEVSWEWDRPHAGALGEVSFFQLGKGAIRSAGYTERQVRRDPYSATRAAVLWLAKGAEVCRERVNGLQEAGPETWLGWYATRGICGGARTEVEKRLDAARWMLRHQERNGG